MTVLAPRIHRSAACDAASAPALVSVAEQVGAVLPTYASVHRGAGYASQVTTALYEHARAGVARSSVPVRTTSPSSPATRPTR